MAVEELPCLSLLASIAGLHHQKEWGIVRLPVGFLYYDDHYALLRVGLFINKHVNNNTSRGEREIGRLPPGQPRV